MSKIAVLLKALYMCYSINPKKVLMKTEFVPFAFPEAGLTLLLNKQNLKNSWVIINSDLS